MDFEKFSEMVNQSKLSFVYSSERLTDEKCQKALKKIGSDGNVIAVIAGNALMGMEGLAISKTGIKFSLGSGAIGDTLKIPKTKGEFSFSNFIINSVSVNKGMLSRFEISMVIWDKTKNKSFIFLFNIVQEDLKFEDSMIGELQSILACLISKTGTEYISSSDGSVSGSAPKEKNLNDYDFVYGKIHTILTLNEDNVVIKKFKIDEKTNIQTPKGEPVTISRSAIGSIKMKRTFSPIPLICGMGIGAGIGFIFIGGIFLALIGTFLGLLFSFPKTMFLYRKDGTKYKTVISGNVNNVNEYDRLINIIFK